MPDTPLLTPVADHERIATLDILRAVALLGVFLINVESFTRPLKAYAYGVEPRLSGVNHAIAWTEHVFMPGNFWTMFALLFGMGFAVMYERAERAGRDFLITYLRRTAALLLFGVAHAVLIWSGDILHTYALAACLLLLILRGRWWWLLLPAAALLAFQLIYGPTRVAFGSMIIFVLFAGASAALQADRPTPGRWMLRLRRCLPYSMLLMATASGLHWWPPFRRKSAGNFTVAPADGTRCERAFAPDPRSDGRCRTGGGAGPYGDIARHRQCGGARHAVMNTACTPDPRRRIGIPRACLALVVAIATVVAQGAEWEGYQKLSREELLAVIAAGRQTSRPEVYAKNLSGVDLSAVDFHGANLSASVFNAAKLVRANLDGCNLTVSFMEGADLSAASLRNAVLFSVQLAGGKLRGADLSGARLIGDLRKSDLSQAKLTGMNAAADMRNQSMGLMRTSMVNATAIGADFSDSDFSRSDFSFSDLTAARMLRTKLYRADFSGAKLANANLRNADLRDATLIDTDFSGADLSNADLTGADFRGVRGLDTAITSGTLGLP